MFGICAVWVIKVSQMLDVQVHHSREFECGRAIQLCLAANGRGTLQLSAISPPHCSGNGACWPVRALGVINRTISLWLFAGISASLRRRLRRAPAYRNSSPEHRVHEPRQGSDIFSCRVPRSPSLEVVSSRLRLVWSFWMVFLSTIPGFNRIQLSRHGCDI